MCESIAPWRKRPRCSGLRPRVRRSRRTRRWLIATVVVGLLAWATVTLSILLLGAFSG